MLNEIYKKDPSYVSYMHIPSSEALFQNMPN